MKMEAVSNHLPKKKNTHTWKYFDGAKRSKHKKFYKNIYLVKKVCKLSKIQLSHHDDE